MKPPDHFSVSQLRKYLGCPLAYRFKYLDRIRTRERTSALVLGKAFHAAAERLHSDMMNGGVQRPSAYRDTLEESLTAQFEESDVRLKDNESRDSRKATRERDADNHTGKFRLERSREMRDNGDDDKGASTAEDTEAERHELAELIGRLLAWDWLEQRRERKQAPPVAPGGHHLPADRSG